MEFRLFLLYTGVVILKKKRVSDSVYKHFLLFHVAYRLLSSANNFDENYTKSASLLKTFVEDFGSIYGEEYLSYNVHNLLYLCECIKDLNVHNLQDITAYKFENYIQVIKKSIKKPNKILQQLYKISNKPPTEKIHLILITVILNKILNTKSFTYCHF